MGIRTIKAVSNAQRGMNTLDNEQLSAKKPSVRRLLSVGKKTAGRSGGTISIRHRGGGTRRQYRTVDFNRTDKLDIPGKIAALEYDPNRTANIALVNYPDGDKRYILAWKGAKVGDEVLCSQKAKARPGTRLPLENIPVGFEIYNLEVQKNQGGKFVRSAGQKAKLVSLEGAKAQVQLPSGEIRRVEKSCFATVGILSNEERALLQMGKAGRTRKKGRRPQVRGKAMNPCDHPHGGGEGGSPIGMKYPKTPWGAHALGVKTRRNKQSDKHIVRSRHRAKKK
ncbi:MAG: 50S ribosomal protein L2 [Candidatus Gracilibacteria bacterium]|nr:50S ribosomal protein L2 [Candidatus Gracilibacteria bacterium]